MVINLIKVYYKCGGCGRKQEFVNSGKFRVNANGNKIMGSLWKMILILL